MQWIYGLFLDLMSYCANALLGIMSTDLQFFETSVPIVPNLYKIFVAIGWGLLIGNCAFQSMKAMFAGFGFETESPVILLMRTFLFGFLLIFSGDICEIGLSIGKNVIDLLGIPTSITLLMPNDSMFSGVGASWLLVIIIGFVLGFQLIKLFFEIAERYVVVAVLTLLCPVGLAFGGSKSTKDICSGFIRTYASMIVMMVMNVLFLKLILSALATMPTGALVLPWCLLVVGIAKAARKADNLISRIGLNPAITGDPLGAGRGLITAAMLARTVMTFPGKGGSGRAGGGKAPSGGKTPSSGKLPSGGKTPGSGKLPSGGGNAAPTGNPGGPVNNNSSKSFSSNTGTNVRNSSGGTNVRNNQADSTRIDSKNAVNNSGVPQSGVTNRAANSPANSSTKKHGANTGNTTGNRTGIVNYGGSYTGGSNVGGANVGGSNVNAGATFAAASDTSSSSQRNAYASNMGGSRNVANNQASSNVRFGSSTYHSGSKATASSSARTPFSSSGKAQVNTNRFGMQPGSGQPSGSTKPGAGSPGTMQNKVTNPAAQPGVQPGKHSATAADKGNNTAKTIGTNNRGGTKMASPGKAPKGAAQTQTVKNTTPSKPTNNAAQTAANNAKKARFGGGQMGSIRQNANPVSTGKSAMPPAQMLRTNPGTTKNSAHADVVEKTDTIQEVIQTAGTAAAPKDGEDNG